VTATMIGVGGVAALFVLVALQLPLAFGLIAVGVVALAFQIGWQPALTYLASEPAYTLANVDIAAVPLFLLMGAFVSISGFSKDLYVAAAAVLGHRKGGLSYATISGCAAFGAICGSSPATVATFTRVALPEMIARGYSPSFSGATIAAGGALKSLIPPSLSMILYCVVAKVFIFDVFVAAVIPALLTIAFNVAAIALAVRFVPGMAPVSPRLPWSERLVMVRRAAPALILILVIFAGLYSGIFTLNEAASVAAVVSFIFALMRKSLTRHTLVDGLKETAVVVGMLYFILIGSSIFTYFISIAHIPELLIQTLGAVDAPPIAVILMMLIGYLILGAIFDELAAMIVTLPFALPIITHLGYDPVWWAIINVVIIELGLIIPPIGLVVLIINAMVPSISLQSLYKSVWPFILADILVLALLTLFPEITLWLPRLLHG
jgi:C4-dicarboxylate transporter DctM subunit